MTDWKITTLLYVPQLKRWAPVDTTVAPPTADLVLPIGPAMLVIEPLLEEPAKKAA